jgi:hypothetical protein
VEHNRFFLFPTQFHQQRTGVIPAAQSRFDALTFNGEEGRVPIEFFAEVAEWKLLDSIETVSRLRGQHVWREEIVSERFDWGRDKSLYAMAVRVFRLSLPVKLPMLARYGGCKSWVELEETIPTDGVQPVLTDQEFARRLRLFIEAVEGTPAATEIK